MKCCEIIREHISLIVITTASISTVSICLLLLVLVRNELKHVENCIHQANHDVDEQSSQSWKILRELNVNPVALRERRDLFRKLNGLSSASKVGVVNRRFVPQHTDYSASINTRGGIEEETLNDNSQGEDNTERADEYFPSADSYALPPSSNPYSWNNKSPSYNSAGYGEAVEYEIQAEAVEKVPECKCSLTTNCPAGPPGPKGNPGSHGSDGENGDVGVDGKDFDDIVEYTPLLSSCIACPEGERGPPGRLGKRGARGLRGAPGLAGIPGRSGNPGSPGTIGTEGAPGDDGELGPAGTPGMDGIKGQGKTGAKGSPGPQGITGPSGDDGDDGVDGDEGAVGERGPPGEPGEAGKDGDAGTVGPEGEPGIDAEYCRCPLHIFQYTSPVNRIL